MTVAEIVFYLLAFVAIVSAIGVVTLPNVVHAAVLLVLTLLCVAAFYLLLTSEFLALTQVLVYAGGIAVLLIFGLMLTRGRELPTANAGAQWPIGLAVAGVLVVALVTAVVDTEWPRYANEVTLVSINAIGSVLFREWLLPFELVGVLLLVALIGAIVISRQEEGEA